MKNVMLVAMVLALMGVSSSGMAQSHEHLSKHGFVLMGDEQIFASHIVYKHPHNYQILIELTFDAKTTQVLRNARAAEPENLFVFVLDPLDLTQIASQRSLTGIIQSRNKNDERTTIIDGVVVANRFFKIIYFEELPLSLGEEP
jgi:hypothetical protein